MAAGRVGVECELAHHKDLATRGRQVEVHSPVGIGKDPKAGDATRESLGDGLIIGGADQQQDAEPAAIAPTISAPTSTLARLTR